jgi:hypothetical protein
MNAIISSGRKFVRTMDRVSIPPFMGDAANTCRDCSTREGAEEIAALIRSVWKKAGHHIDVWVDEAVNIHNGTYAYCIRSELLNGLPRRGVFIPFKK